MKVALPVRRLPLCHQAITILVVVKDAVSGQMGHRWIEYTSWWSLLVKDLRRDTSRQGFLIKSVPLANRPVETLMVSVAVLTAHRNLRGRHTKT